MNLLGIFASGLGAAGQVDTSQLFPRPGDRTVLACCGQDLLSQLRADAILKRSGLKAKWILRQSVNGIPTLYLEAERPEEAYDIQRVLLKDGELNSTTLGLAVPAMTNGFFSFPSHFVTLRTHALPSSLEICGNKLSYVRAAVYNNPLFKRESAHKRLQKAVYSLRCSGKSGMTMVDGLDLFVVFDGKQNKPLYLRFEFLNGRLLGSERLDRLPQ